MTLTLKVTHAPKSGRRKTEKIHMTQRVWNRNSMREKTQPMLPNYIGHRGRLPATFVRPRTASDQRSDSNPERLLNASLVVALPNQEEVTRGGFSSENTLYVWIKFQTTIYKSSSKENLALASLEVTPGQKTSFASTAISQVIMQRIVQMVRSASLVAKPAIRKQTAQTTLGDPVRWSCGDRTPRPHKLHIHTSRWARSWNQLQ